jgi:hypothetical protein
LKKFCNSYPFYLLISLLLVFEPSSKNRWVNWWKEFIFVFLFGSQLNLSS